MRRHKKILVVAALASLVFIAFSSIGVGPAYAWVYGGDRGYYSQDSGNRVEDYYDRDCFGWCGPGCNLRCGYTYNCQVHDYYMRKHGLWSWQQAVTFPPALIDWGACMVGRAVQAITNSLKSLFTGIVKSIGRFISGIFN